MKIEHENIMRKVLNLAVKAQKQGEIPVGCIILKNKEIISAAYNQREKKKDVLMHAEIIAIRKATKKIKDWRLDDCLLYVNLEPCLMCFGAIVESRIKHVICGAKNKRYNDQIRELAEKEKIKITYGILEVETEKIFTNFFVNRR